MVGTEIPSYAAHVSHVLIVQEADGATRESTYLVDVQAAEQEGGVVGRAFVNDVPLLVRLLTQLRSSEVFMPEYADDDDINARAWELLERYGLTYTHPSGVPPSVRSFVKSVEFERSPLFVTSCSCLLVKVNLCR